MLASSRRASASTSLRSASASRASALTPRASAARSRLSATRPRRSAASSRLSAWASLAAAVAPRSSASAERASAPISRASAAISLLEQVTRRPQRQPGLPRPASARECDEAHIRGDQQPFELVQLLAPADEGLHLGGQVVRTAARRAKLGKLRGQRRVHELVDALRLEEILQPVQAEVEEGGAVAERVALRARPREDDLASVGDRHQARAAVEGGTEVVRATALDRACVDAHADSDRAQLAPVLLEQGELPRRRRLDGRGGVPERRVDGVADRLEDDAAVPFDRFGEQLVVPRDPGSEQGGVALEQLRASLDVAEEEADLAFREFCARGHRTRILRDRGSCSTRRADLA